jgi:alcohol dehydrogenase (cytochrome c)
MKTLTFTGALLTSLLVATALTPVRAADMTHERALNVAKEPHNWLLHHGNYEGWRFSQLKQINTETVKNMKLAFTVALGGYESGGRYKHGNLEATPIIEDGMMYVPDGWGSVYAIDVTPAPIAPGLATSPAAGSTTAAWRFGRTRSSRSRSTAACLR